MAILFIFSAALAITYSWWTARVWKGFAQFAAQQPNLAKQQVGISIVIPLRNEEENLTALLQSISRLNYPPHLFEVILVNDASEDQSVRVVESWMRTVPLKARLLQATESGKKAAQFIGIAAAKFELIACTDADCELPENWLHRINAAFANPSVKLAFGPVLLRYTKRDLQQLEFLALIGSTMGMLQNGWPVMGNAANMAVQKSAYLAVFPNLEKRASASGDDVFLLHALAAEKGAIALLRGRDAFVHTQPQESLKAFILQRMRWASKAKLYTNKAAVGVALLIFCINTFLLFLAVFSFLKPEAALVFLMLFGLKSVADFVLLKTFGTYFSQPVKLLQFVGQEFLNLLYIPLVALLSQLFSYKWKGRNYGVRAKAWKS